jgi:hypothetical protein
MRDNPTLAELWSRWNRTTEPAVKRATAAEILRRIRREEWRRRLATWAVRLVTLLVFAACVAGLTLLLVTTPGCAPTPDHYRRPVNGF